MSIKVGISVIALTLTVAMAPPAMATEVPNTVALRKVSDTRYNLSMNFLDQYAQQEIGIRIRRITGSVSEIFIMPNKALGDEGKATVAVNRKLLPEDVFLFIFNGRVFFKSSVKGAAPSQEESTTVEVAPTQAPTLDEPAIDKTAYPNDAVIRKMSGSRYLLTMNMLDTYVGAEISIERTRKVKGEEVTAEIAKVVLGPEGKAKVVFQGTVKAGDIFILKKQGVTLFTYFATANL